jgi:hypothetical protein
MHDENPTRRRKLRRVVVTIFLAPVVLFALLLIPEPAPPTPKGAGKEPFIWNRQGLWSGLEKTFALARAEAPEQAVMAFHLSLAKNLEALNVLPTTNLPPDNPLLDEIETNFFLLASKAAAGREHIPLSVFLQTYSRLRSEVKRQSEHWPMDTRETRERLYRALYGSRAAVEEVLLQLPPGRMPPVVEGDREPSQAPSATVRDITIHSGDILISRGGAATSALIARGNDFPGNFSHVALVHVDGQTKDVSVIESHIESGVTVRPIEKYLGETKLRILVLRLRADLPQLAADPLLPHRAASLALQDAARRHIPYDFAMDHADPAKQFCSEVAAAAYKPLGVNLWMGMSHLSSTGVTSWLAALGVRHFETQEPSDLEYDPQLRVVVEWRDPETLFKDHVDNAVIDVMLESAEKGERLGYDWHKLPFARLAKAYSVGKNLFGGVGPIPEGMSATTALRVQKLKANHADLAARLLEKIEKFKAERGYVPPYWELVRLAGKAHLEQRFVERFSL